MHKAEETVGEKRSRTLRLKGPPAKRHEADVDGIRYGRAELLQSILVTMESRSANRADLALTAVVTVPRLHTLAYDRGVALQHAAAASDSFAPVLALLLAHAAAEGPHVLKAAVRRHSTRDIATSSYGESRTAAPPGGVAGRITICADAMPLHVAALNGALECAALLIAADKTIVDERSAVVNAAPCTALDVASACGHVGIIRLLLRAGANPSLRGPLGWVSLHWACEYARVDAVRTLLMHGADPNAQDSDGLTPAQWALQSSNGFSPSAYVPLSCDGHDERVSVLVELVHAKAQLRIPDRADVSCAVDGAGYPRSLLHACSGGLTLNSLPLLRKLLANMPYDFDINCEAGAGGTPLDLAVHSGWSEGALELLNHGADVNEQDARRSTPLMRAAALKPRNGGSDLIRLCVQKGANLELQDEQGWTALHHAVHWRQAHAVRTLRAAGANLNARNNMNQTAEAMARNISEGSPARAEMLAILTARECPPRLLAPNEDATCFNEEVVITGPDAEALILPDTCVFISESVPGPGFSLRPRLDDDADAGLGASCCNCVGLCIPGLCSCLIRGDVDSLVDDCDDGVDDGVIDDCLAALRVEESEQPQPDRGFKVLLAGDDAQRSWGTAMFLCLPAQLARFDPLGALRLGHAAAAAAMVALRRVRGVPPDETWARNVRGALKASSPLDRLAALLLELDDAAAAQLEAARDERDARRWRGLWETRQGAAWLSDARPCWRAGVRAPSVARNLPSLRDQLATLAQSLASVHSPLRVAAHGADSTARPMRTVRLCSPSCLCAAGGCRATGVQFPLLLRQTPATGLGAFAAVDIPAGSLVSAFVGEAISDAQMDVRWAEAKRNGGGENFYALDLDSEPWKHLCEPRKGGKGGKPAVLDPEHYGNVARNFNHACKPTLLRSAVEWSGLDCPLVFLYAGEHIAAGTELTWDYFSNGRPKGFTCKCASCAPSARGGGRRGGAAGPS
jgi:ankyrin repeat protein